MKIPRIVFLLALAIIALGVLSGRTAVAQGTRSGGDAPSSPEARPDPRAEIFVWRGCTACHAISGLGVQASTDVGPDLTNAYVDVVHRYGVNLEYFLFNPVGVMELLLVSHLSVTAEDRDSIVNILRRLYEERRADIDGQVPFLPPARAVTESVIGHDGR